MERGAKVKTKMRIKYRQAWLLAVEFIVLSLAILSMMFFLFMENRYGFAILCLLLGGVLLVAVWFRGNYGLTIHKKWIIAIEQTKIKIFRYEDVRSITVKFTNEQVTARIQTSHQQEHAFVWDKIYLRTYFSIIHVHKKVKLDKEFVEKSIANLSTCPKVKIQNFMK